MKIEILGAHGLESERTKFVSVLVDGVLALDGGSLALSLSLAAQERIKAVLLTHSHLDHTMSLVSFSMHAFLTGATVEVYAIKDTIDVLLTHVFNGVVHLDSTRTPSVEKPALRFHALETYKPKTIDGYTILAFPVYHSVPAVGYQVTSEDGKSIFYSGDTGPGLASNWEYVHPNLLVLDCGASNRLSRQAPKAGHMTPALLKPELTEFRQQKGYLPPAVLVHMASILETEIKAEAAELARDLHARIDLGYEGMEIEV